MKKQKLEEDDLVTTAKKMNKSEEHLFSSLKTMILKGPTLPL